MPKRARAEYPCDYRSFDDPMRGLAAMILVQAINDLEMCAGRDTVYDHGTNVRKWEIVNFLRSSWGCFLAEELGIDSRKMNKVVNQLC